MDWVFLALLSSALWASSNFFDKYLVKEYFSENVETLIVFSSIIGIFVAPFFLLARPEALSIAPLTALIIMANSALLILYLYPYLKALRNEDVSVVTPLFQLIPVLGLVLGFAVLGERLSFIQIFASAIVILSAIGISLDFKKKLRFGLKTFALMLLSSLMIAVSSIVFKIFAVESDFLTVGFWQYIGFSAITLTLLIFFKGYRLKFFKSLRESGKRILSLNAINETINIIAQVLFWFSLTLAPIGLVWVFNGFQPFFMLAFGLVLTVFFPKIIRENISRQRLLQKAFFIVLLFIGGIMLALNS